MKKRDSQEYIDTHWSNERAYKNGYAKGVKEFAERLKQSANSCAMVQNGEEVYGTKNYQISEIRLDYLVKEKVGTDNGC